jgi:ribosome assembly protein YihI (activator of Der GTPase)
VVNVSSDAYLPWFTKRPGQRDSCSQGTDLDALHYPDYNAGMKKSIVELDHDELVDEELDEILERLDKLESVILLLADRMDEMSYVADKLGAIAELLDTTKSE